MLPSIGPRYDVPLTYDIHPGQTDVPSDGDLITDSKVPVEPPDSHGESLLASKDATPAEQYDHYKGVIESHGGKINPKGATVLGIRGQRPDGRIHKTVVCKGYSDTFVVLNRDTDGAPKVLTLLGATYPAQTAFGGHGVSIIQPGSYAAVPNGTHGKMPSFWVQKDPAAGDDTIPAWRDANRDGLFSDEERKHPTKATEILFHHALDNQVTSAGCQTMPPQIMGQFISAVGGADAGFDYTLVETGGY